jgi:ACS family sodium-dependent inorganic phosphate cotransporter-like MFS transporter 5
MTLPPTQNMSVAIVAMVNHTSIHADLKAEFNECPDTDYGNSTDHEREDGEFNWTTETQGIILASFFVGYVITQVRESVAHIYVQS